MSLPNGIDVSKDERYVFVAAIARRKWAVSIAGRHTMTKRAVWCPFGRTTSTGPRWQDLTAGPNYVAPACAAAPAVRRDVGAGVDPVTLAFSRLGVRIKPPRCRP